MSRTLPTLPSPHHLTQELALSEVTSQLSAARDAATAAGERSHSLAAELSAAETRARQLSSRLDTAEQQSAAAAASGSEQVGEARRGCCCKTLRQHSGASGHPELPRSHPWFMRTQACIVSARNGPCVILFMKFSISCVAIKSLRRRAVGAPCVIHEQLPAPSPLALHAGGGFVSGVAGSGGAS